MRSPGPTFRPVRRGRSGGIVPAVAKRAHDPLAAAPAPPAAAARVLGPAGADVCERCVVADSYPRRLRGLLGRTDLAAGEGLLLRPCGSVHTWFLRFPIDVVFLDRELVVLRVVPRMGKWRMASARGAGAVLELAAAEAETRGIRVGDRLTLEKGPQGG